MEPEANGIELDANDLYYVDFKELYTKAIKALRESDRAIITIENPFSIETFPKMRDIAYDMVSKKGSLIPKSVTGTDEYEKLIEIYHRERYTKDNTQIRALNENIRNMTGAKLFNVVTEEKAKNAIDMHLSNDTRLVIKIVDLGSTVNNAKTGIENVDDYHNDEVEEFVNSVLYGIYNEIRVAFFLNELRYAYSKALTHHFMIVVDWFVSDINLYPELDGIGPFQYIVSERLDTLLSDYLQNYTDMTTLKSVLFCVAQALEAAWATHEYIHYDLHSNNVMLKKVENTSFFYDKNFVYTRAYSPHIYRLPSNSLHNMIVKIIDFGSNRMKVPSLPLGSDKMDLFEHIGIDRKHTHDKELRYIVEYAGQGVGENRTYDLRRLLWDLATCMERPYWISLKKESPEEFSQLTSQMEQFINVAQVSTLSRLGGYHLESLFRSLSKNRDMAEWSLTVEELLLSPIRYCSSLSEKSRFRTARLYGYQGSLRDLDQLINDYVEWENHICTTLIWSNSTVLGHDVTSFLSSQLFDNFIITDSIITSGDAWMGERASDKVLRPDETY